MKKIISACLILTMCWMAVPAMTVFAATPAELGWTAYQDDFTGWTVEESKITGTYGVGTSSWLRRNPIADIHNFVIELDLSGDRFSSPYIRVLNVTIEVGGNNGDGNQIYLKVGDQNPGWIAAQSTKVHLKIGRFGDNELHVEVTGEGKPNIVTVDVPIRSKEATVEVGTYRGIVVLENFVSRDPIEGEGPLVYEAPDLEQVNSKVNPVDVNEYFLFRGTGSWGDNTGWTTGSNETEGRWLVNGGADEKEEKALYIREKLSGNWLVNCTLTPQPGDTSVSRVVLYDQGKIAKMRVTAEHQDGKWRFCWDVTDGNGWETVWQQAWVGLEDTALNVRMDKLSNTQISLKILGDQGYTQSVTGTVPSRAMESVSYAGVSAEGCVVRFTNFRIGTAQTDMDYRELAKQTYDNLMKNFLDKDQKRLYPVRNGFIEGTVTNTGATVTNIVGAGEVWESTVMLMALDTYAQTLEADSAEYREVAEVIANTVNMFLDFYPEEQLAVAGVAPNYLMDDTGWTTMALLLGYYYNRQLGNGNASETCFRYAKMLFNSAYEKFYKDDLGTGLVYSEASLGVNGYGATLVLSGWYIHKIDPEDESLYKRVMDVYNGMETYLRRPDGMYWCEMGPDQAYVAREPYGIQEAGSCTYIGANMAMAVVNTLMGNPEKAMQTFLGIARYETYSNGAFMNDRDAWNNTFFLGMFVREFMGRGYADGHSDRALYATVDLILKGCVLEDGYYSACWSGPYEPDSAGWPSIGTYQVDYQVDGRNRWGMGYNNNGLHIGSTPNQIMTSATTAHVLLAAALNQKYDNTAAELTDLIVDGHSIWPVFNPAITGYRINGKLSDSVTLTLPVSNNAAVTVNGETVTNGTYTAHGGLLKIVVTAGNGAVTRTYTLDLGEGPAVGKNTIRVIAVAGVAVLLGTGAVLLARKKRKTAHKTDLG